MFVSGSLKNAWDKAHSLFRLLWPTRSTILYGERIMNKFRYFWEHRKAVDSNGSITFPTSILDRKETSDYLQVLF
jgi:hypothetical protein